MRPMRAGRAMGLILWGVLAVVVVAGVLLAVTQPEREPGEDMAEKPVLVKARVVVASSSVPDVLDMPGRTEPVADVMVAAERSGVVTNLPVDKGDTVAAGDLLLAVDADLARELVRRAEIELRDAERDLARHARLKTTGAVSDSDYDAIKTRVDVARVSIEEARINLANCRVSAPLGGRVEARFVEPGEYVNEGQPVLRIVDTRTLKVSADIPERDIGAVRKGAALAMTVDALRGRHTVTGRVAFVAADGRPESNCFPIELVVTNPPAGLRAGMIVQLSVVRRRWDDAVVVPLSAVVPRKGDHIVFVVESVDGDLRAASRVIRMDRILGDRVLVSSGIEVGDRLVLEGQRTLQDGQQVVLDEG